MYFCLYAMSALSKKSPQASTKKSLQKTTVDLFLKDCLLRVEKKTRNEEEERKLEMIGTKIMKK